MKLLFPKKIYQHSAEIYKLLANPKWLEIINLLRGQKLLVFQSIAMLRPTQLTAAWYNGLSTRYNILDQRIVESRHILN